MVIGSCRECGHQVSSEAENCPSCGCPRPYPKDLPEVPVALVADEHQDANSSPPSPHQVTKAPNTAERVYNFVVAGLFPWGWLTMGYYIFSFNLLTEKVRFSEEIKPWLWVGWGVATLAYLLFWVDAYDRNLRAKNKTNV